jgi:hypothetical protein
VWKDPVRCVAELTGSFTGSFSSPTISEAGRAFLASLLVQLSDAQLRDLFVNARVKQRSSNVRPPEKDAPLASRRMGDRLQAEAGPDRRPALPA